MSAAPATICIYSASDNALVAALRSHLTVTPRRFDTLGALLGYLRSPDTAADIAVLAPADADELAGLQCHDRLQDRRLVLILPDAAEATLSLAHLLGPRYLCFADDVGTDLVAVLNKMVDGPGRPADPPGTALKQAASEGVLG